MAFDYHLPPVCPQQDINIYKYFYIILFIKSNVYNVKGQAIVFRRKTLDGMIKLVSQFDQEYIHSRMSCMHHHYRRYQYVDFLVKYDDKLDNVLKLIDVDNYIVKLSWQNAVDQLKPVPKYKFTDYQVYLQPDEYMPVPPPSSPVCPPPPPPPHQHRDKHLIPLLMKQLYRLQKKIDQIGGKQPDNMERVRIISINDNLITVQYIDQNGNLIPDKYETLDINKFGYQTDQVPLFYENDDCLMVNKQYLVQIDPTDVNDQLMNKIDQLVHHVEDWDNENGD